MLGLDSVIAENLSIELDLTPSEGAFLVVQAHAMLLEPFQYATGVLIMFLLSFSINDNIVGDILVSREAREYFLDCGLEEIGCYVNFKQKVFVSSESDVCAVAALWCQLKFVVPRRKVLHADNCRPVEVSNQTVDG